MRPRTWVQFFRSTCDPPFLFPKRERVDPIWPRSTPSSGSDEFAPGVRVNAEHRERKLSNDVL
jgi:hypothetical protein